MRPNIRTKAPKPASTALVVARSTQLAIPDNLAEQARELGTQAWAPGTLAVYAFHIEKFKKFCDLYGHTVLPASPETLVHYILWLTQGQPNAEWHPQTRPEFRNGYVVSKSFLTQMRAALEHMHMRAGQSVKELFKKNQALNETWRAALRTRGQARAIRRVDPITDEELRDILECMNPDAICDARDMACLLYTSPSPRDGATSRMPSSA